MSRKNTTSGSSDIYYPYDDDSDDEPLLPAIPEELIASTSSRRDSNTSSIFANFSESLRETAHVTLTFQDVTVWARPLQRFQTLSGRTKQMSIPKLQERIMLLDQVSGFAKPGEVLAIMGASGSGKSTLLNAITSRNLTSNLDVSGSVRANGLELGANMSKISGYLQQDDMLFPSLTVREYLRFQTALCLGDVLDYDEQNDKVDVMLTAMGLLTCQHTRIGGPGYGPGISGGEMKRLAFAAELLTNPAMLFCDEPTTGLDSFRAEQIVAILCELASMGKTIVCVIHQPSSAMFDMFHRVIFLANGRVAFQGATNAAKDFFQNAGYLCPESYNPAEHIVNVLAMREKNNQQEAEERIGSICDTYNTSGLCNLVREEIISVRSSDNDIKRLTKETEKLRRYRVSCFAQLYWLLWRAMLDLIRDPKILQTRILQKIILGLLYGLTFHGTVLLTQEGVQNTNGAMLNLVIESSFRILIGVIQTYNTQLPIFYREHSSYLYRPSVYYMALVISWFPVFLLDISIFVGITYFLMGLSTDIYKFAMTLATSLIMANVSAAVGSFLAFATPSMALGIAFAQQTQYLMMLFSGALYISLSSYPIYLGWMQYLSWMRYGYEAMSIVHWSDIQNITCTQNFTAICLNNGLEVLESQDFIVERLDFDLYMLGVLFGGFHILAFGALLIRLRLKIK